MRTFRLWLLATFTLCLGASIALAQPAGWSHVGSFTVTENSGVAQTNLPVQVTLNTATLIAGGQLRADAGDLRFGSDQMGSTLYGYWIESGINTASTVVWVNIPALGANATITVYFYYGNPSATSASTLSIFDGPHSATNQISGGSTNTVSNCQRGFQFHPNTPVLVTQFGKDEPSGSTRYLTLFNYGTQAIVHQQQVSGAAATYSYADVPQPFWLAAGTDYVMELHNETGDMYYYQNSTQVNSNLTYVTMLYCNSCDQNTFPTDSLGGYHYGYPDFQFYARKTVSPAPTVGPVQLNLAAIPVLGIAGLVALMLLLSAAGVLALLRRS